MNDIGMGDVKSPMIVALNLVCAVEDRKEIIQEWAKGVEGHARSKGLDVDSSDFVALSCSLEACGGHATYRTAGDMPLVDVPCPCDNPDHWLIKWTET